MEINIEQMSQGKRRICLVSYGNPYLLPYINTYIDSIKAEGAECCLLYWDRNKNGNQEDLKSFPDCKHFPFSCYMPTEGASKWVKLSNYIKATRYIIKVIKEEKFDGLVFLQTQAAVACINVLRRFYKQRYIVDVRDYTMEDNALYKYFETKVFSTAYRVVISSPAYKNFLPKAEYVLSHNYTEFPKESADAIRDRHFDKDLISISFVGAVRYYEMNRRLLDLFANDSRFKICFYGRGSETLEDYAKERGISNVDFHGSFPQSKTLEFYENTSLINNLYGNHNKFLDYALSNKLYHAAQLYIPILVCPETYMEEVTLEYGLGFVVNLDDDATPDKLYNQYEALDWSKFKDNCDKFVKKVKEDNQLFNDVCSSFAKGI